ncbi:4'-phosphopantetheinyl transferase superfamily protein [Sorangium sp. So ce448]|uniref:4'-phosphopantetheinyl transferase n=1 Tax=Sorangium cellulosum (strain So ce56) TaxID=448385 RepID=A9FLK4_SORC5|nr:4'-phosphopantetheinyl transferase superfamily protein [Sorangium cellulosum]CAN95221.1 4'-phosphopantetheinyl transferase [Sorangium cellulosum So ce56]
MLTIGPGAAHLWYVFCDSARDEALLEAYHRLMAPDEAAQQARFLFAENRHEYLLTRALVRTVLSKYANVAPEAWSFVRNEFGRPQIAGPPGVPPIRFNLSNTRGLIACLVALDRDVGVDVEDTERASSAVDIADRFFSPGEVRALRALPPERQRARFFEYWTLKESYIKARGMGLAIPLDQFSFHLDDGPAIGISFDPRLGDDRSAWQFALYQPSARHTMAAAIRSGGGPPLSIELRETVPLRDGG